MSTTEERFWEKVRKGDGCWVWIGAIGTGRPYFRWRGRQGLAYRYAWERERGLTDKQINHTCDNALCVRIDHLYDGTQQDNMTDKRLRKRSATGDMNGARSKPERLARGEHHGNAKMTDEMVRSLRERYAAGGVSQPQLAREVGVSLSTLGSMLLGKTWKHAGGPVIRKQRRLTEEQIAAIRSLHASGMRQADIIRLLRLGRSAVQELCSGKSHGEKQRHARSTCGAKLTAEQVQALRDAFAAGERQVDLAARYGISQSATSAIILHSSWAHL